MLIKFKLEVGLKTWVVENVDAPKVQSTHEQIAVVGGRTVKLVDQFRGAWGYKGLLIKFKLEVGLTEAELVRVAEASRVASGADLMVANTLAMARPSDGSEGAAILLGEGEPQRVRRGELAARLVSWVRQQSTKNRS